jgi:hypothetical protein
MAYSKEALLNLKLLEAQETAYFRNTLNTKKFWDTFIKIKEEEDWNGEVRELEEKSAANNQTVLYSGWPVTRREFEVLLRK